MCEGSDSARAARSRGTVRATEAPVFALIPSPPTQPQAAPPEISALRPLSRPGSLLQLLLLLLLPLLLRFKQRRQAPALPVRLPRARLPRAISLSLGQLRRVAPRRVRFHDPTCSISSSSTSGCFVRRSRT